MVEFALVAPVFFVALFGSLDGGLLMFSANAVNHATGLGMITVAQEGTTSTADTDAMAAITAGGVAALGFAKIDEVDIYLVQVNPNTGVVTADSNSCNGAACLDRYGWNGTSTTVINPILGSSGCVVSASCVPPWSPSKRNTAATNLTNLGITLKAHYNYLAFTGAALNLAQTRYFRLEPTS